MSNEIDAWRALTVEDRLVLVEIRAAELIQEIEVTGYASMSFSEVAGLQSDDPSKLTAAELPGYLAHIATGRRLL